MNTFEQVQYRRLATNSRKAEIRAGRLSTLPIPPSVLRWNVDSSVKYLLLEGEGLGQLVFGQMEYQESIDEIYWRNSIWLGGSFFYGETKFLDVKSAAADLLESAILAREMYKRGDYE